MDRDDRVILRAMAWERAKGELQSISHLYTQNDPGFEQWTKELEKFIRHIEHNAIGEFL